MKVTIALTQAQEDWNGDKDHKTTSVTISRDGLGNINRHWNRSVDSHLLYEMLEQCQDALDSMRRSSMVRKQVTITGVFDDGKKILFFRHGTYNGKGKRVDVSDPRSSTLVKMLIDTITGSENAPAPKVVLDYIEEVVIRKPKDDVDGSLFEKSTNTPGLFTQEMSTLQLPGWPRTLRTTLEGVTYTFHQAETDTDGEDIGGVYYRLEGAWSSCLLIIND